MYRLADRLRRSQEPFFVPSDAAKVSIKNRLPAIWFRDFYANLRFCTFPLRSLLSGCGIWCDVACLRDTAHAALVEALQQV